MGNRLPDKRQNTQDAPKGLNILERNTFMANNADGTMQIIESLEKMQEVALEANTAGKQIALVATSGALNAGHAALIERARSEGDLVVVAAIVNPAEFGPNEDYQRYPRNSSGDAEFCEREKVDVLFRPLAKDLFPENYSVNVSESKVSGGLCGISRPHYFKGVCTFFTVMFNLIQPDHLVLGQRDAQKNAVLKKLVKELFLPVEIHVVDTVRDESGLAYNTRNAYLNDFQQTDAATLYKSLLEGKKLADSGITNVDRILAEVTHHISQVRRLRVIYVAAVDPDSMKPVRSEIVAGRTLVMAAVWCDEVRLIDNILL
ncbi:MAG: pantoate--beta-alanine ligase [Puniceicoccaceae bacterium]